MTTPIDSPHPAGVEAEPPWLIRLRAPRVGLPEWAEDVPTRCVYDSNETGTWEIYAWDRETGSRRQVTQRPNGTSTATISPDGAWVWWFDDTDGDEHGVWRVQPFTGPEPGGDRVAAPAVPAAYSAGLALSRTGFAVIGCSTDDGTALWLAPALPAPGVPGSETAPRLLYAHHEDASVVDISYDGSLLLIEHSEHGDSRHSALRVLRADDGSTVADLWDGPGLGLDGVGFAPTDGDARVLVVHERRGREELLVWDPIGGAVSEVSTDLPGEVSGDWWPGGDGYVVLHAHHGRSDLHRLTAAGARTPLGTPAGVVDDATVLPDGTLWYSWSSAAVPPALLIGTGEVLLSPLVGPPCPPSVPVTDVVVPSAAGDIHAFLLRPAGTTGALPGVFVVHGGPEWHDEDGFRRDLAAWVDHGFAAITVNYRGSTGYGSAWRDAIGGDVGRTELEDIAAVRDHLVATGVLAADRIALTGGSWGGYLTLLGLGTQPESWACGVAVVPVADYIAAYEDEMESLKAFDRALFGGSPEEISEVYRVASPITYVDAVTAPVLILAGANDPRCPLRQIENYLAALAARGHPHEVYRFDAGHGSLVMEERIKHLRAEIDFVSRHLGVGAGR